MQTYPDKLKKLSNSFDALKVNLGTYALPGLTNTVDGLNKLVTSLVNLTTNDGKDVGVNFKIKGTDGLGTTLLKLLAGGFMKRRCFSIS